MFLSHSTALCHMYWKSQSDPFSCTDQVGRQHQMNPGTKEMKLCPQRMSYPWGHRKKGRGIHHCHLVLLLLPKPQTLC